jgi:hypothetical protein
MTSTTIPVIFTDSFPVRIGSFALDCGAFIISNRYFLAMFLTPDRTFCLELLDGISLLAHNSRVDFHFIINDFEVF